MERRDDRLDGGTTLAPIDDVPAAYPLPNELCGGDGRPEDDVSCVQGPVAGSVIIMSGTGAVVEAGVATIPRN